MLFPKILLKSIWSIFFYSFPLLEYSRMTELSSPKSFVFILQALSSPTVWNKLFQCLCLKKTPSLWSNCSLIGCPSQTKNAKLCGWHGQMRNVLSHWHHTESRAEKRFACSTVMFNMSIHLCNSITVRAVTLLKSENLRQQLLMTASKVTVTAEVIDMCKPSKYIKQVFNAPHFLSCFSLKSVNNRKHLKFTHWSFLWHFIMYWQCKNFYIQFKKIHI